MGCGPLPRRAVCAPSAATARALVACAFACLAWPAAASAGGAGARFLDNLRILLDIGSTVVAVAAVALAVHRLAVARKHVREAAALLGGGLLIAAAAQATTLLIGVPGAAAAARVRSITIHAVPPATAEWAPLLGRRLPGAAVAIQTLPSSRRR